MRITKNGLIKLEEDLNKFMHHAYKISFSSLNIQFIDVESDTVVESFYLIDSDYLYKLKSLPEAYFKVRGISKGLHWYTVSKFLYLSSMIDQIECYYKRSDFIHYSDKLFPVSVKCDCGRFMHTAVSKSSNVCDVVTCVQCDTNIFIAKTKELDIYTTVINDELKDYISDKIDYKYPS